MMHTEASFLTWYPKLRRKDNWEQMGTYDINMTEWGGEHIEVAVPIGTLGAPNNWFCVFLCEVLKDLRLSHVEFVEGFLHFNVRNCAMLKWCLPGHHARCHCGPGGVVAESLLYPVHAGDLVGFNGGDVVTRRVRCWLVGKARTEAPVYSMWKDL